MAKDNGWVPMPKVVHPNCDLCPLRAVWMHPAGGYRCGTCPRPKSPDHPK